MQMVNNNILGHHTQGCSILFFPLWCVCQRRDGHHGSGKDVDHALLGTTEKELYLCFLLQMPEDVSQRQNWFSWYQLIGIKTKLGLAVSEDILLLCLGMSAWQRVWLSLPSLLWHWVMAHLFAWTTQPYFTPRMALKRERPKDMLWDPGRILWLIQYRTPFILHQLIHSIWHCSKRWKYSKE